MTVFVQNDSQTSARLSGNISQFILSEKISN